MGHGGKLFFFQVLQITFPMMAMISPKILFDNWQLSKVPLEFKPLDDNNEIEWLVVI